MNIYYILILDIGDIQLRQVSKQFRGFLKLFASNPEGKRSRSIFALPGEEEEVSKVRPLVFW